jgi:transcription elongation GreA/GreB family factor
MARQKMLLLKRILDKKIADFEKKVKISQQSALDVAKSASLSPSMSGDREHAEGQAVINKKLLEKIIKIRDEVDNSLDLQTPDKIKPTCFVLVNLGDDKKEFFLATNVVSIRKVNLLSADSPLGRAIVGKKVGDNFTLILGKNTVKGKIVEIG